MEEGKSQKNPLVPPDGGYGWIIVLAVLLQMIFVGPIMPMFGLLFGSKFEEFETTPTEQTSVFAAYLLTWNIITMFVGPLVQLRSERFVGICGTTCVIIGLVFCAFSQSTTDMMLSYGIGVGAGMGLSNANGILILSKFFKKKVGLAYGLFATGLGVGALVLPQLVKLLLQNFSGKQSILIYASLASVGYIGALLMRDVKPLLRPMSDEDHKLLEQKNIIYKDKDGLENKKPSKTNEKENSRCENFIIVKVFCMIKWNLLWDPFFVMVAIGNSVGYNGILAYVSQLRTICSEKGLDVPQTADVISVIAFTEIFSRVFQGILGDRACIRNAFRHSKKMIYTFMGFATAVCFIGISFTYDFVSLAINCCLCSIFTSGMLINSPLIYGECFPEDLPSAIGLSNLFRAVLAILLGPTTGMLNSHFGTFNAALNFLSAVFMICMIVWVVVDLVST